MAHARTSKVVQANVAPEYVVLGRLRTGDLDVARKVGGDDVACKFSQKPADRVASGVLDVHAPSGVAQRLLAIHVGTDKVAGDDVAGARPYNLDTVGQISGDDIPGGADHDPRRCECVVPVARASSG